jgi:DNA polymerase V
MASKPSSSHGGFRPGAGRKPGGSAYGEPTQAIRVPVSWVPILKAVLATRKRGLPDGAMRPALDPAALRLPLFASNVPAGFPSPADDYAEGVLDLNYYLVEHEAATFYVRVKGHSMTGAGILDGDIIAVDRALEARHGDIVLAVIDNELTVKELHLEDGWVRLLPHHPDFPPIDFKSGQELAIWGVVMGVVRKLR